MLKPKNFRVPWELCSFVELYENSYEMPLCERILEIYKNSFSSRKLILIHHLNEPSLPFIKILAKKFQILAIIGIPYSNFYSVINVLKKDFNVITPESLDQINGIVMNILLGCGTSDVLISEIGGYTSKISSFLDKNMKVKGIVEDTTHGQRCWENKKLSRLPIYSLANSNLKRFEDNFVAKSIIDGIDHFLFNCDLGSIQTSRVLIIGFGNVGEELAKYLKPLCKQVKVFDIDPIKMLKARNDYEITNSFRNVDTVIGATGNPNHSINARDIDEISDSTLLFSGSSKRVEFDLNGFKENATDIKVKNNLSTYYFNKKRIKVANSGEPINLGYSIIPARVLDLVYAGIILSLSKIDTNQGKPGLNYLSEKEQQEIARLYCQIYGIDLRSKLLNE